MRRIAILLAILVLACATVACKGPSGVEESAVFVNPNAVKEKAYGALYFSANGFDFGIYDRMEDVLSKVPANTTFTGESCAFDGDDIYYFFNGFEVMANVIDGAERVTAVTITDDTVKTPQGLYIGMPEAEMESVLHTPVGIGGMCVVTDGTAQLHVTVQDGTVRAIAFVRAA